MELEEKAFEGIFIYVDDISTDLIRYLDISPAYLKYNVGNYLNIFKRHHENTWTYIEIREVESNIVAADRPIAKTSQDVFAFIFECDLES